MNKQSVSTIFQFFLFKNYNIYVVMYKIPLLYFILIPIFTTFTSTITFTTTTTTSSTY